MTDMTDIIVTLYYAKWCGHCTSFKPKWNELKKTVDELTTNKNLNKNGINTITFREIEDSEIKGNPELEKQVDGFPTIVITNSGKDIKYEGPRTVNEILKFIYETNDLVMNLSDSEIKGNPKIKENPKIKKQIKENPKLKKQTERFPTSEKDIKYEDPGTVNNDQIMASGGSIVNYRQKYHKYKKMYADLVKKIEK
jgi:thiol-disulfide isomerase/thioredoxin